MIWLLFEVVALSLYVLKNNLFYLLNFSYIVSCIAIGTALMSHKAKIVGPLFFGRGWCGYACWTGMILDLLPYKVCRYDRKNIGWIRYVLFILSFVFISCLFLFKVDDLENIMVYAFVAGNIIYYAVGIILAIMFKDNRAFCKYICPVTVFLKPASYFSILRVKCNHDLCIGYQKCVRVCHMDVDMLDDSRKKWCGVYIVL